MMVVISRMTRKDFCFLIFTFLSPFIFVLSVASVQFHRNMRKHDKYAPMQGKPGRGRGQASGQSLLKPGNVTNSSTFTTLSGSAGELGSFEW